MGIKPKLIVYGDDIISKQFECQRYVFKIHSSRLRASKWNLTLPLTEARRNDEVISLASSQVLRWIDELNGVTDADERAKAIRTEIKRARSEHQSSANTKRIKKLYADLDELQFKKDYMCLVIDKIGDYRRACSGFTINGIKYVRLLGTPGGIKTSTIIFVSESVSDELKRRIDNGRDTSKTFAPAKLEAYKALTCSASTPLSLPNGILVVDDVETTFRDLVINISNPEDGDGEPVMSEPVMQDITITASDGCGMMLPALAERWSSELNLDYMMSGCCLRYAFTKGMVYTFPFNEFAENVAHSYIVKDIWGNDIDIRNVEIVLPISMVKLWSSYSSVDEFVQKSIDNGYTFGATKVCVEELESERSLNYQFIQCFDLDNNDIDELIQPTIDEINDVLGGDWAKTILYLKGCGLNERSVQKLEDDWVKALMVEPKLVDDPFVRSNIYNMIKKRITDAKVGVVKVHGNYSTVCGDLYALCQKMFGMEVTGCLNAGEIYNEYWHNNSVEEVLMFRAPMSCAENVKKVRVVGNSDECNPAHSAHWFRYMHSVTVLNAWDSTMCALNGMDFDGDLTMTTDNPVLLRRFKPLPTLMCAQKSAAKKVPEEVDFINSNIASFGNEVGKITNRVTSMYEVRAKYKEGSNEYNELTYRIRSGQLYQQDSIDKAKGIISKPMPTSWYNRHGIDKDQLGEKFSLYKEIVAERKPFFMVYIYPSLMRQYHTYVRDTNKNAMRRYGMSLKTIEDLPLSSLSDDMVDFVQKYRRHMPVGFGDCVMNTVCRKFETEFDRYVSKKRKEIPFDYNILRNDSDYSSAHYNAIKRLMSDYDRKLQEYSVVSDYSRVDTEDVCESDITIIDDTFRSACAQACPDEDELCNIVLDLCYSKEKTKQFAWKMCGNVIVRNLLNKREGVICYPTKDLNGEIKWKSGRYSVVNSVVRCQNGYTE